MNTNFINRDFYCFEFDPFNLFALFLLSLACMLSSQSAQSILPLACSLLALVEVKRQYAFLLKPLKSSLTAIVTCCNNIVMTGILNDRILNIRQCTSVILKKRFFSVIVFKMFRDPILSSCSRRRQSFNIYLE